MALFTSECGLLASIGVSWSKSLKRQKRAIWQAWSHGGALTILTSRPLTVYSVGAQKLLRLLGCRLNRLEHKKERLAKAKAAQVWGLQNVLTDNMHYIPTRWPESPRIVIKRDKRAPNGPYHLGLAQVWGLQNVLTDNFFETWTELYQEVISRPGRPGFVGKHFPYSFYIRCRGAGGEEWCLGQEQKKRSKRFGVKIPHFWLNSPRNASLFHPSFGGMVRHADTVMPADQNCNRIEPPSYQSRWQ